VRAISQDATARFQQTFSHSGLPPKNVPDVRSNSGPSSRRSTPKHRRECRFNDSKHEAGGASGRTSLKASVAMRNLAIAEENSSVGQKRESVKLIEMLSNIRIAYVRSSLHTSRAVVSTERNPS
jgi:hypothetical protein